MLFHEPVFLYAFLPATLTAFLLAQRYLTGHASNWILLSASLLFYGWWDPRLLPLLVLSIVANHRLGSRLASQDRSSGNGLLVFGIAINLVLLGGFKYADFLVTMTNDALGTSMVTPGIPLPLAISFFTFLQIAFLVDCRKTALAPPGLTDYALFVSYFPHLVAGPLVHHRELIPQFGRKVPRNEHWENLCVGSTIFLIGLAKKTLLAQPAGVYSDKLFDATAAGASPTAIEAWVGSMAFAFQIYFDFSAYSDMAIGLSRLFGIWLPLNFASPYKATSIIDFWRRWHITLSRFLRDYLYVPLGGSRLGSIRRYANVLTVMLLGGLWHGAGWTFVLWGGLHGLLLAANHLWRDWRGGQAPGIGRTATWFWRTITFGAVVVLWVPFRAESLSTTISIWAGMVGLNGLVLPEHYAAILWMGGLSEYGIRFAATPLYGGGWQLIGLALALTIAWTCPSTQEIMRNHRPALNHDTSGGRSKFPAWRPSLLLGIVTGAVAVVLFARTLQKQPGEFIYFQF